MLKKAGKFLFRLMLFFFISSIGAVIIFRFVPLPFTSLMYIRCVQQKMDGEKMKKEYHWVPLSDIANSLQLAVVTSEDQNFLFHHGFDFEAIEKAMKYNERQAKRKKHPRVRGASTISQQCAKNAFLFPARSFIRKGLEVYFTALIELLWSKERIMEVYLNVIEMGDGIYGAEAAAQAHFHTHAKNLTAGQSALIAACLPNPIKFNAGAPTGYVFNRQAAILRQMQLWGGRLDYDMKEEDDEK